MSEMLGSVDTILKKAKVRYILGFGTLLGAVRHKGFIPWDDDIDLFVFEEDFPAAVRVLEEELAGHEDYALQSNKTDPMFWHAYVNVRHLQSRVVGISKKVLPFQHRGLFVSLFPAPAVKKGNLKLWIAVRDLVAAREFYGRQRSFRSSIMKEIAIVMLPFIRGAYQLVDAMPGRRLRAFPGWKDVGKYYPDEDVLPLTELEFDQRSYPAPKNHHQVLTDWYGDYMILPPLDKRHAHFKSIEISQAGIR